MSLFISFEGGEGSGKTTQAQLLEQRLRQDLGLSVLSIHEPGTTPLGSYIRNWLKGGLRLHDTISHRAELFLFAAARAELVTREIKPALAEGSIVVVADRYADSTTAYQGYGRKIPLKQVNTVNSLATQHIMPDLTFFLDCSPEEGRKRIGSMQLTMFPKERMGPVRPLSRDQEGMRFEEESLEFHHRVRAGYLEIAEQDPDRWCVIDATRSVQEISDIVWDHVRNRLDEAAPETGSARELPLWADGPQGDSDQEAN